ncbi:hypothetical protein DEO72_LG6g1128 [Vigna unguiculata]|uniref:Uncharacterized protein n=1 Tax=Vigna unguiculata TaxID=3917 RepID=A0A4D6M5E5_VIGUN|nr:hypothetical protein DEO72_LG6g1128 [Vigna unguiculata]
MRDVVDDGVWQNQRVAKCLSHLPYTPLTAWLTVAGAFSGRVFFSDQVKCRTWCCFVFAVVAMAFVAAGAFSSCVMWLYGGSKMARCHGGSVRIPARWHQAHGARDSVDSEERCSEDDDGYGSGACYCWNGWILVAANLDRLQAREIEVAGVVARLAEMVDVDLAGADEQVRENGGAACGGSIRRWW